MIADPIEEKVLPKKSSKKPSHIAQSGCSFLIVKESPKNIFISEEKSEEQKMIYDTVREFCTKEIYDLIRSRGYEIDVHDELELVKGLLEKAGELGLCGVAIEEKYGGIDLNVKSNIFYSEASAYGFSFATTIGAQTSIGSLPIVLYGTEEQKSKYLPGIATGQLKGCYCLTEPSSGSDANSGKTKAHLNDTRTHYVINGQKLWITNGGFADIFIVFAKIENDENLSAFIIEREFGGLTTGEEEKKLGIKGSSTVPVFLENCQVPVENLLGNRNEGFKMALNILNSGRIKLAGSTTGGCKLAVEESVKYAKTREQFGKPIAQYGAIKHKIGQMSVLAFAMDAALYRTSHNIDLKTEEFIYNGMDVSKAKLQAIREYAVECSILKVKCSESVDYCIDECLQIHGGMGYMAEMGIEMGYRDARITRIYEGTNEINRMLSLAELTKRAIKTKEVDLVGAGKKIPAYILKQALPFKSNREWDQEERIVKNLKTLFMVLSGKAGQKLKEKMVDEQEIVMNYADILAESYIAESVLLKVQKLEANKVYTGKELAVRKQAMQVYLYDAIDICRKAANESILSYTTGPEAKKLQRITRLLLPSYSINTKAFRRNIAEYNYQKNTYGI